MRGFFINQINYKFIILAIIKLTAMQNPTQYLIIIVLIGYSIFRRVMRAVNFQKYKQNALLFKVGLYSLIEVIMLALGVLNPVNYLYYAIGAIAGAALVFVGVRHMIFEKRKDGLYYRTHVWVEIGILTIFFTRLAYRFYAISQIIGEEAPEKASQQMQYARDPFTGFVFFLLCTYYIGYYFYVYRRSAEALKTIPDYVDVKKNPNEPLQ